MCKEPINGEDYAPITQALRGRLTVAALMQGHELSTPLAKGVLAECDNIDALHKALEEQNAKLHEKVLNQRKQLADVQEAIERRNNGILKRRWQKKLDALKKENEEMRDFNYRVREAIRRHEDLTLWGTDYMALPVDADGVPIHVGDWIVSKWGTKAKVVAVTSEDVYWWEPDGCHWCHAFEVRHHHKPTVMNVLDELLMNWPDCEGPEDELALKNRIAKRLQLADGDAE